MKNLWLALLNKAIQSLIDVDWNVLRAYILSVWDEKRDGEEKRKLVFLYLRNAGSVVTTWLLNVAIEVAYGQIKSELEKHQ